MLLNSCGIVLSSTKYSDNSLISKVFSKDRGIITLIYSRTKSKKKKTANYFQPLSNIDFVCYISNKSSISRTKEVAFNTQHAFYSDDAAEHSLRYFLAELLSKVIKEEEKNISLYQFIENQTSILKNSTTNKANFHIQFLFNLLTQLGMQPQLNINDPYFDFEEGHSTSIKPTHTNFCENDLIKLLLKSSNNQSLSSKLERSKVLNTLLSYYSAQLGIDLINLKSKRVFEELFC